MATTYDKGDLVRLTATFTVNDAVTDPTTVTLYIRSGAGVLTTLVYGSSSITKVSVGVYRYDYSASTAGDVSFRWAGTTPAQASDQDTFFVLDLVGV